MESTSGKNSLFVPAATFFLVLLTLSFLQIRIDPPILIFERFIDGAGWVEVVLLSFYGAYIARLMLSEKTSAVVRLRIWTIFSCWFFIQLFIGLLFDRG